MNVRIIANPISGGGRGQAYAEALLNALELRGLEPEFIVTRKPGDAEREAARPGAQCVVAVGGDGSANEVANGLAGTETCLAILPLGTANAVARELKLPRAPDKLAELIVKGNTRRIDVGVRDGRRFLQSAGAGLDAAVVEDVHAHRGRRLGFAGYVLPIVRTARRYTFPPVRVIVDGGVVCEDARYALVGNCPRSAGAFAFTPEARLDSGVFDVCMFRDASVLPMLRHAAATFLPGFTKRKGVLCARGREIRFESPTGERVPLQIDGDPAGELPVTLSVEPGALPVIAP